MLVKIHNSYRTVVAICDSHLIGKTFEENQKVIEVSPNFFKGEEKTESEVLEIIEEAAAEDSTFNIVGQESVSLALKAKIVNPDGILTIQGVPVALVLL